MPRFSIDKLIEVPTTNYVNAVAFLIQQGLFTPRHDSMPLLRRMFQISELSEKEDLDRDFWERQFEIAVDMQDFDKDTHESLHAILSNSDSPAIVNPFTAEA